MEKIIVFILLICAFSAQAQYNKDLEKALYVCDSAYTIQGQHLQNAIVSDSLKSELIVVYKEKNNTLTKQINKKKIKSFIKGTLAGVVITLITLIFI